jgi:hypothetical protein
MSEHEERADELEAEAEHLKERTDKLEAEIGDVREDWERKKSDPSIPGAPPGDGDDDED